VQSLIHILYTHFTLYFANKFNAFIKSVIKLLIQHNLFNKRCKTRHEDFKEEKEVTHQNMIILSSRFTLEKAKTDVQIITSTFIQSQNIIIITDANIYKI